MRNALALLLASLVLTVASPAAAQRRAFVVGDSHVFVLGRALTRDLAPYGIDVVGWESRHGWSTAQYRRAGDLRELLEANGRPEIVIVSLGGNDEHETSDSYRDQIRWIVDEARAAGAERIVWLGPGTCDPSRGARAEAAESRHEHNADLQRDLVPTLGARWIDSRPYTHRDHRRDGVHFTRAGYALWADGVLEDIVHDSGV